MTAPITPAQAVLILHAGHAASRTYIGKSQGHLAPFLATSVQAAEAQIDVETGFPAALTEPGYGFIIKISQIAMVFNE